MNREMKAAMDAALKDILAMSPEEFLAAAHESMSGEIFDFFMTTGKFESFDIKNLDPLQVQFAEVMPEKMVSMLSKMRAHNSQLTVGVFETVEFALAA